MTPDFLLFALFVLVFINMGFLVALWLNTKRSETGIRHTIDQALKSELSDFKHYLSENQMKAQQSLLESFSKFQHQTQQHTESSTHHLKVQLTNTLSELQNQIRATLQGTQETLANQFDKLNQTTEKRLHSVGEKVEEKLSKGFEKTSQTFTDIVKRLALIDDAQKKIHELSSNVVSLQEILQDKRSRGMFGEIQLKNLLDNALPESAYAHQYTLSNQHRVDSILFLPEPTGHIAIDAKFPLENYKLSVDGTLHESERKKAAQLFKQDIKKHISDIAQKYIIAGETSDGALMFIPAEAVFAEIHAHHPDLVELAHQNRVWMTSPTTMMAILTTASAVLKDSATRKQVHVIQKHLRDLSKDFERFDKRMDNLARHINQANEDVGQVQTSAKKITNRFIKIENVELGEENPKLQVSTEDKDPV